MTSKKGLSGAQVIVTDDRAVKIDYNHPEKVKAQGEWLLAHPGPHLPAVISIMQTGYSMELLEPIPTGAVDLEAMIDALSQSVWSRPDVVTGSTPHTMLYLTKILSTFAPQLLMPVLEKAAYLRPTTACLTHGDPTAENVMLRGNTYVVIDAIPATCRMPDDLAVDVGKILQSAHGWEDMKGEERATFGPRDVADQFTEEAFNVGQLWCIVHFVRTLPYAKEEVRNRVILKLHELLGL